ncbi:kinase-like domain-containing protein, partial [Ustulina deusta]
MPAPKPLTRRELDRLARTVEAQTKRAFSSSRGWEFEKALGNGSFGLTVLLRDRDPLKLRRHRRVVLKRALRQNDGVEDFVAEMRALWDLRGHAHIAQMLDSTDNVGIFRPRSGRAVDFLRRIVTPFTNPPENVFKALSHFYGPAIVTEYLENGSLLNFRCKQIELGINIPNRVLWSFYHCLVRACVAMTSKKEAPYGQPLELEIFHEDKEHYALAHNDIAARNIMFGDREPDVPEHRSVPKLVLIDFGLSQVKGWGSEAEYINLGMVAREMICLINPSARVSGHFMEFNGFLTQAFEILPMNGVDMYPHLDPELRNLLVVALGPDESRPTLQEMLRRTHIGVRKPASAYNSPEREADNIVNTLLQEMVYDAV